MTTTRGLSANSALALAGDVTSKVGALAVVVVAARCLSVSEFALLVTGLAAAGILGSVLDLGAGTLLTRDGARGRAERGALLVGLLKGRAPVVAAVLVAAPAMGVALGKPLAAVGVAALGTSSALAHSVLGLYRSCQDLRPEALQRLGAATLSVGAVAIASMTIPRADVLLLTLAAVALVSLVPLVLQLPARAAFYGRVPPLAALRAAAPIGLLALATIAYYRSGTLALAALADDRATAAFGIAASIAFGLLALPNAVTTALLPRLAADGDRAGLVACARRALALTVFVAILVSGAAAVVVPVALPWLLGPDYEDAGVPFALLCVGLPLIAASGVIGTALLSIGRLRALGVQVALSLVVNLLTLALLVPAHGAVGASLATVACEAAGLALLAFAARNALPGLLSAGPLYRRRIEAVEPSTP
jgi:O-antigen/teichoic acid export membrane protein